MPGLRSLIARRRCSLPVQHISNAEPTLSPCTLTASTISSKPRNSLDSSLNHLDIDDAEINWNLKNLFHCGSTDKTMEIRPSNRCLHEREEITNVDNESMTNPCDSLVNVIISNENCIKSAEKMNLCKIDEEFSEDNLQSMTETLTERIVIKMKLLHGDSVSDIESLPSDSSEDVEVFNNTSLEAEEYKSKINASRWTIDSILNEPVAKKEVFETLYSTNPVNSPQSPSNNSEGELLLLNHKCSERVISTSDVFTGNETSSLTSISMENENAFIKAKSERRLSNSSDTSIESKFDGGYPESDCSSSSSVKSCSIVIKKIKNSDVYSCFQTPKRKKMSAIPNNNNNTPSHTTELLPCSVLLCDIFPNFLISDTSCPNCLQNYGLSSNISIDTGNFHMEVQCAKCDWLVIRRIKPKQILLPCKFNLRTNW